MKQSLEQGYHFLYGTLVIAEHRTCTLVLIMLSNVGSVLFELQYISYSGNFRGRKLHEFQGFVAICKHFLHEIIFFTNFCESLFGSKHFIDFHKRCGWQVFNYQHLVFKGNVVYIYRIGT